jgi:hypothetical protein
MMLVVSTSAEVDAVPKNPFHRMRLTGMAVVGQLTVAAMRLGAVSVLCGVSH